jgi:hypothetical protein
MDNDTLVAGGAGGLDRIAECFRLKGIPVSGIYLIKLTAENGFEDWIIRLVSDHKTADMTRRMVQALVQLRRDDNCLPHVDSRVRFDLVSRTEPEPERVLDYAARLGGFPVTIRDAMWKGLFIEYALVPSVSQPNFAIA